MAIENAKNSNFKATALKLELEAVSGRGGRCPGCIGRESSDCDTCDAYGSYTPRHAMSDSDAREFIRQRLTDEEYSQLSYLNVVNDPSVDIEVLATIMLGNWENVYIAQRLIEIFNELCEHIGGQNVDNAGMHLSFLNNSEGLYPTMPHNTGEYIHDWSYFDNFKESIERIMPALYLLGTDGERTRSFHFRKPQVSKRGKFSAIYYNNGALEFRVFDTCYQRPEAILDFVTVMSNSLRYWGKRKITGVDMRGMRFGKEKTIEDLNELFFTQTQLDALNKGVALLKPRYLTIAEIKQQRGFKVDKKWVKGKLAEIRAEAEKGYEEYVNRKQWIDKTDMNLRYNHYVREITESGAYELDDPEVIRKANAYLKQMKKDMNITEVMPKNKYMMQNAKNLMKLRGDLVIGEGR